MKDQFDFLAGISYVEGPVKERSGRSAFRFHSYIPTIHSIMRKLTGLIGQLIDMGLMDGEIARELEDKGWTIKDLVCSFRQLLDDPVLQSPDGETEREVSLSTGEIISIVDGDRHVKIAIDKMGRLRVEVVPEDASEYVEYDTPPVPGGSLTATVVSTS